VASQPGWHPRRHGVSALGDLNYVAGGGRVTENTLDVLFRWFHFVAGIIWIGLLYFLNFVNVPTMRPGVLDPAARPAVITTQLPRTLAWFRHAAWITVLAGFLLLWVKYWQYGRFMGDPGAQTIHAGMLLGLIMVFNVWFLIWPNQKKIIEATRAGQAPDPSWGRIALYASRTNVTLSWPMLFYMASASHGPFGPEGIVIIGIILGALAFAFLMTVQKWQATKF
jgi:uncharacterized membrane protein